MVTYLSINIFIYYAIIFLLSSPYREVRLFDLLSHSFLKRVELCLNY